MPKKAKKSKKSYKKKKEAPPLKPNGEEILQCVRELVEDGGVLENNVGGCLLKTICELIVKADAATKYGTISTFGAQTMRLVTELGNLMNKFCESEKRYKQIQDIRDETKNLEEKLKTLKRVQGKLKPNKKKRERLQERLEEKYGKTIQNLQERADKKLKRAETKSKKKQKRLERLEEEYKETIQSLQETANNLEREMTHEMTNSQDKPFCFVVEKLLTV